MIETVPAQNRPLGVLNRLAAWIEQHWLSVVNVLLGIFVLAPWLAPPLMKLGADAPARVIYAFYSTQCHQLPQRSFFLFGQQLTYTIPQVNAARGSESIWTLREFIGNVEMGYKVAWSDRMISLYTSVWLGGLLYALLRKRVKPLPWILLAVLLLPLVLDGGSHFVSDLWGIGRGFRDSNAWLQILTGQAFADSFYIGDGWGSFNSITRLWTGVVAGLALAWAVLPRVDKALKHGVSRTT